LHFRDSEGRSCLELAALYGLISTLRIICGLGVNINERTHDGSGYTVLMHSLSKGHYECAELLVSLGCDLESVTLDGLYLQTMLHHFIDIVDEEAAVFLIKSGCDGNAVRVPRDSNNLVEETPLHRAVSAQMNKIVAALVSSKTNLNVQDAHGRTACHICVQERNHIALSELLKANDVEFLSIRDKFGHTPFSQALFSKQHVVFLLLARLPHVALQTNGNGENLLHTSVKLNDLESVLFLLSTSSDATRATDGSGRNALHYAADVDNELILRNLLLVGCDVNVTAKDGSTALHAAVRGNRPHHTEILLENAANANQVDDRHENALSVAVRYGSLDCVKVLLDNSSVDGFSLNKNGQSALHLCAMLTTEKVQSRTAPVEICELLLRREARALPEKVFSAYVDLRDADGNTALMLAYMVGNGDVCRCLLRYGATMGARNSDGDTIFTYETPTRLLLFRLLDSLEKEPRWSDGDICDCGVRFSITVRKHHCRHCGRLVCAKCSEVTMPIAKFGEEKRVRVCSLCVEVLTKGVQ
uniref:FYVE-type domain-containing protein n=1 Tax=Angiostrongylus costaricensis TaxID=334426 RepID=A0A158PI66_ANGCS